MITTLNSSQENVMYNTMTKTFRDGSKQVLCATKRVFRQPGWEYREVDTTKTNLVEAAEDEFWWAYYGAKRTRIENLEIVENEPDIWVPSEFITPEGWPLNWREMPVEEMTVGMLAKLDEEERLKPMTNARRAMRRARVKVRDYALSTDMEWFCTFTLDKEKISRYDIHEITKKLNMWLNHQVSRRGLCYVMVPELHKDGAVHFHGLLNGAIEAEDSGTVIPRGEDKPRRPVSAWQRGDWLRRGGRIVYNLPSWPYGFTTALKLEGCYEKAVNYVCKYISKGLGEYDPYTPPQKIGGRWYYSGGDLKTPGVEFFNSNMEDLERDFGRAARRVVLQDLRDVEMIVVWINANGIPRESVSGERA